MGLFVHRLEVEGQASPGIASGPQVRPAGRGDQLRGVAAPAGHVPGVPPERAAEHRGALVCGHVPHQGGVPVVAGGDPGESLFGQGLGVEEGRGELEPFRAAQKRGFGVLGVDRHADAGLLQDRVGVVPGLGGGRGHHHVGLQVKHQLEVDPRAVADFGDPPLLEAADDARGIHHFDVAYGDQVVEAVEEFEVGQLCRGQGGEAAHRHGDALDALVPVRRRGAALYQQVADRSFGFRPRGVHRNQLVVAEVLDGEAFGVLQPGLVGEIVLRRIVGVGAVGPGRRGRAEGKPGQKGQTKHQTPRRKTRPCRNRPGIQITHRRRLCPAPTTHPPPRRRWLPGPWRTTGRRAG